MQKVETGKAKIEDGLWLNAVCLAVDYVTKAQAPYETLGLVLGGFGEDTLQQIFDNLSTTSLQHFLRSRLLVI